MSTFENEVDQLLDLISDAIRSTQDRATSLEDLEGELDCISDAASAVKDEGDSLVEQLDEAHSKIYLLEES